MQNVYNLSVVFHLVFALFLIEFLDFVSLFELFGLRFESCFLFSKVIVIGSSVSLYYLVNGNL
jgi:hypothetical protein